MVQTVAGIPGAAKDGRRHRPGNPGMSVGGTGHRPFGAAEIERVRSRRRQPRRAGPYGGARPDSGPAFADFQLMT
jgi:hypothetical protein